MARFHITSVASIAAAIALLVPTGSAADIQLTRSHARTARASSTPSGSILVSSSRGDVYDIVYDVVDAGGGGLKELWRSALWESASWTPDGRRLRLGPSTVGDDGRLHTVGLHGDHATRSSAWTADGRWFAYVRAGSFDTLRVLDVRTGRIATVATASNIGGLVWSPDGRRIAFERGSELWVVERSGANQHRLSDGYVGFGLSWSPDGRRIVFGHFDPSDTSDAGWVDHIVVVDVTSGRRHGLFQYTWTSTPLTPAWSPAGDVIAFAGTMTGRRELILVRPDGRLVRVLMVTDQVEGPPVWSPDGGHIAVQANGDVWVVDVVGHARRRVTQGWRYGYDVAPVAWNPRDIRSGQLPGTPLSDPSLSTDTLAGSRELRTTHPVIRLAMDGSRVAMVYGGARRCTETWDVQAGTLTRFPSWGECGESGPGGALGAGGIAGFALAGERLTWSSFSHFAGHDIFEAHTATMAARRPVNIDGGFVDDGRAESDLQGHGNLLVFDQWRQSCGHPSYPNPCAQAPKQSDTLFRLDGAKAVAIASSGGALTPLAVDSGRILVDHADGRLELLDRNGSSLRAFPYDPTDFVGAKVDGRDLVILEQGEIDDVDAATGALLRSWPLHGGEARLEDVANGIAVYVSGDWVHVVRLDDGRDVALPSLGTAPRAQIEAQGLVESWRDPGLRVMTGRVVFVPFDELPFDG